MCTLTPGWTTWQGGQWLWVAVARSPRDGENDTFHMDMVKGLCLGDKEAFPYYSADPQWDMTYMRKGGENWLTYAPHWYERKVKKQKKRTPNLRDKEAPGLHFCEKKVKSTFSMPVPGAPPPPPYIPQPQGGPYKQIYPLFSKEDIEFLAAVAATGPQVNRTPPSAQQQVAAVAPALPTVSQQPPPSTTSPTESPRSPKTTALCSPAGSGCLFHLKY